jgi:hypothetical protein
VNYIRLYGNRASHTGSRFSEYDIRLVNSSYKRIVYFFYERLNEKIPNDIKKVLDRLKLNIESKTYYNKHREEYIKTLVSVESSDDDYPSLGLNLISNICSKIIIDNNGFIPKYLIKNRGEGIFLPKAISYIKENALIDEANVSLIDGLQTFFHSSSTILENEKKTPEVNPDIIENLRILINWFYNIDTTKTGGISKQSISAFVDLSTLVLFWIVFYLGMKEILWKTIYSYKLIFSIVAMGIIVFNISFLYNSFHPYIKILKKRSFYYFSRYLNFFTTLAGLILFATGSYFILKDGLADRPFLPLFIFGSLWAISVQFSFLLKLNKNSKEDKQLIYASYYVLVLIIAVIIYFAFQYGDDYLLRKINLIFK